VVNLLKYFTAICFVHAISGVMKLQAQETVHYLAIERMDSGILKLYTLNDSLFVRQENLINGKLNSPEGDLINHPYFMANEWNSGKIWVHERVFEEDMLKYDICSDNLINVFKFDSAAYPVTLNRETVREFVIRDHHFKYLSLNQDNEQIKAGYYEVLHDGRTCLYLHHQKSKSQNKFTLETEYLQRVTCYLEIAGKCFQIKNQNDFLHAFGDHENEVRLFMKKNSIRLTLKKYESLIKVLVYFDKLNLI
jgi:hypothetical protein